jgi:ribose 1,5-bisphosphokinase PhnN
MKAMLYVVNGPSGAGKSHLLRFAEAHLEHVTAIPKLTTRPPHPGEDEGNWSDLIHVSDHEFVERDPEFRYTWNGFRYGVERPELKARLDGARVGLVVVRDPRTIRELIAGLAGIEVVPIYVTSETEARRRRMLTLGLEPSEVARRLGRDEDPGDHYRSHVDLYEVCLENDSTLEVYQRRISDLILGRAERRNARESLGSDTE